MSFTDNMSVNKKDRGYLLTQTQSGFKSEALKLVLTHEGKGKVDNELVAVRQATSGTTFLVTKDERPLYALFKDNKSGELRAFRSTLPESTRIAKDGSKYEVDQGFDEELLAELDSIDW